MQIREQGVTKISVLQGVQEDYGDALSSSEMRFTHFEACEEDVYMSENEIKCGKAVSKQLIAGEYCMSRGTMDKQLNDSILHQQNKIEILGKVFQQFRDMLMVAVSMWYDID